MSDESCQQQLKAILARVDGWYEAFVQSPAFARLSVSQQREAGAITESFARYTYDYLGLSPDEWDGPAAVECCTEFMPRKVSAAPSFFEALAPVLGVFFRFLGAQALLPDARALAEAVEGSRDRIMANAADRSHWGPAKHFVMAAQDAGVDIHDSAALGAFMLGFNLQQVTRANVKPDAPFVWPVPHPPTATNPLRPGNAA